MRRRDATFDIAVKQREHLRPRLLSVAVSVLLHSALIVAVAGIVIASHTAPVLIHVSIAAGGGPGTSKGGGTADAPPLKPPAPAVAPPLHLDQPAKPPVQRNPRRAARPRPARADVASPPLAAAADAADHPSAAAATNVGSGEGSGQGLASGSGIGSGGGTGGGSGGGTGGGDDQRAYCVYCPEPRYPLMARQRGWQGVVDVGLQVLADGSVEDADLQRSSGFSVLDQAAVQVARQSRFTPPATLGLPAPLRGRIEYRFQLSEARRAE
jgi:TonB family protein